MDDSVMDDYDDYGNSDGFSPVPVVVSVCIDASMPVAGAARNWYGTRLIEAVETEGKGCPQKAVPDHTEDQVCTDQAPKTRQ